jgi:hypothetical protein
MLEVQYVMLFVIIFVVGNVLGVINVIVINIIQKSLFVIVDEFKLYIKRLLLKSFVLLYSIFK